MILSNKSVNFSTGNLFHIHIYILSPETLLLDLNAISGMTMHNDALRHLYRLLWP